MAIILALAAFIYWFLFYDPDGDSIQPQEPMNWIGVEQWDTCGMRNREPFNYRQRVDDEDRIVYGEDANEGEYPWHVDFGIRYSGINRSYCGGALLNSRWILTAAHCCVPPAPLVPMIVKVGGIAGAYDSKARQVKVDRCFNHPSFVSLANLRAPDIALLRIENGSELKPPQSNDLSYNSICLPEYDELRRNQRFEIAGFGLLGKPGQIPAKLQKGLLTAPSLKCSELPDEHEHLKTPVFGESLFLAESMSDSMERLRVSCDSI